MGGLCCDRAGNGKRTSGMSDDEICMGTVQGASYCGCGRPEYIGGMA